MNDVHYFKERYTQSNAMRGIVHIQRKAKWRKIFSETHFSEIFLAKYFFGEKNTIVKALLRQLRKAK
jgi:hypothetical protein